MKSTDLIPTLRTAALGAIAAFTLSQPVLRAADHRDAPNLAHDAAADLADVYFFMDPNNNGTDDKVIMIATFHGFIVPGEAVNEAIFDPNVRYHFELYDHVNTNVPVAPAMNATPAELAAYKKAKAKYLASIKVSRSIDVTFSPRLGRVDPDKLAGKDALEIPAPQTATVQFTGFAGIKKTDKFTADLVNSEPSLGPTATTPAGVNLVGKNSVTLPGVKFFAGEVDDPFFFDIPAFSAFIKSVRTGAAPSTGFDLTRARDTFAGYNVLSIALSLPATSVTGPAGTKVGLNVSAQRHSAQLAPNKLGVIKGAGAYKTVDRMGNPAVNVVLLPFSQKNAYNSGTPKEDATGKFVGNDTNTKTPIGIVDTLLALGTDGGNIGTLANLAVFPGDLLILDTSVANSGNGGGDNANTGFATMLTVAGGGGGRRLKDDVVDTLVFVVTNGTVTTGDGVANGGTTLQNEFPFLAPPNQPKGSNTVPVLTIEDNTRN